MNKFIISNSDKTLFFGTNFTGAANLPRWVNTKELSYTFDTIIEAASAQERLEEFLQQTTPLIIDYTTLSEISNEDHNWKVFGHIGRHPQFRMNLEGTVYEIGTSNGMKYTLWKDDEEVGRYNSFEQAKASV